VKNDSLGIPFLSSVAVHIFVLLIGSAFFHSTRLQRPEFLPIGLVDLPRPEPQPPVRKIEAPPEIKKPPPPVKEEKAKENKRVVKREHKPVAKVDVPPPKPAPSPPPQPEKVDLPKPAPAPPPAALPKDEAANPAAPEPAATETMAPPNSALRPGGEGGGSEAGAGKLFGKGDVGVIPGPGTAGGGGGTAASGLGRGSGAPGLPAPTRPVVTNRQAKPIQTAKASYPPMALRAGLESDVTLRIEVDTDGKVTRAEIIKSGGAGFDEEALKAVKQSRFEPAQRDGRRVPAEFTYVYRFRLAK
jgi:protein TonB